MARFFRQRSLWIAYAITTTLAAIALAIESFWTLYLAIAVLLASSLVASTYMFTVGVGL